MAATPALRIAALLAQVEDLFPGQGKVPPLPAKGKHRALFDAYVEALSTAKQDADDYFEQYVEVEIENGRTRKRAEEIVAERRPIGPAAMGGVIAVIREFWLKCQALNDAGPEKVAPQFLILAWLTSAKRNDLAEFLSALPFWPLGLDAKNRWV